MGGHEDLESYWLALEQRQRVGELRVDGLPYQRQLAFYCGCGEIQLDAIDFPNGSKPVNGGYGCVHTACSLNREDVVAVKFFRTSDAQARFKYCVREMVHCRLASIASPKFVVPCHSWGFTWLAISQELCAGQQPRAAVSSQKTSPEAVPFLVFPNRGITLWDFLLKPPAKVDCHLKLAFVQALVQAFSELHTKRLVHGDLKGNNVLVGQTACLPPRTGSVASHQYPFHHAFTVKLIDFGRAVLQETPPSYRRNRGQWDSKRRWKSPEYATTGATTMSDVWALCMLILTIVDCPPDGYAAGLPSFAHLRQIAVRNHPYMCCELMMRVMDGLNDDSGRRPKAGELYILFCSANCPRGRPWGPRILIPDRKEIRAKGKAR